MTGGGERPFTITISKGSALLPEMKALLRAYRPGEPLAQFRDRVLGQDLLGRLRPSGQRTWFRGCSALAS